MAVADPSQVWLLEEFLTGREHSFDAATLHGQTLWASISDYLRRHSRSSAQSRDAVDCRSPQDISTPQYAEIHRVGPQAIAALGVQDAFSHIDGSLARWSGRGLGISAPPGAQIRVDDRLRP